MRISTAVALGAGLVLALAGCSDDDGDGGSGDTAAPSAEAPAGGTTPSEGVTPPSEEPSSDAPAAAAELGAATSDLGEIVVDGQGMTVYMFTNDTQGSGASVCTDQCAAAWPAVHAASATPTVEGVTGEVGTITGVDGELQVTLNGWPLYLYAQDQAAGDVTGQGVGSVWYVISPDGEPIMAGASSY
jgi:predicted lipoprotein with Yx(FWY)xxD motif